MKAKELLLELDNKKKAKITFSSKFQKKLKNMSNKEIKDLAKIIAKCVVE